MSKTSMYSRIAKNLNKCAGGEQWIITLPPTMLNPKLETTFYAFLHLYKYRKKFKPSGFASDYTITCADEARYTIFDIQIIFIWHSETFYGAEITFTALVLFCDPLTMTVAPYIRERCLKETEMLYVWHTCWMVGELGSGMGWRIPAIGNSNMSTNGSSSYNKNEQEILKTRSILNIQQFYSSVIMYWSVMI